MNKQKWEKKRFQKRMKTQVNIAKKTNILVSPESSQFIELTNKFPKYEKKLFKIYWLIQTVIIFKYKKHPALAVISIGFLIISFFI